MRDLGLVLVDLFLCFFSLIFFWFVLLVTFVPFLFFLARLLFRNWWRGLNTPSIIERPVGLSPEWAKDVFPCDRHRCAGVCGALENQNIHDVLFVKYRYYVVRSFYDGGERAYCFFCGENLTSDFLLLPRLETMGILTVTQAIEKI